MAIIGDAGGGTTTSVCQVSPGDEKAILGNLISRLADIETFLSKLVAADVYANNLAELARDMGNLVNGSIMMPADPNSPIGPGYGSIPVPEGYTGQVINGNQVTTWENGVVSFSVLPGTGVTTGGSLKTAIFRSNGGSVSTGPTQTIWTWSTVESQGFVSNGGSSLNLNSGLYLLTAIGTIAARVSTTGEQVISGYIGSPYSAGQAIQFNEQLANGETTISRKNINAGAAVRFPDDLGHSQIKGAISKTGATTITAAPVFLSITRLGA